MQVTIYTKPGCSICDTALQLVGKLTPRYDLQITQVNILEDPAAYEKYKERIPVIEATDAQVGQLSAPITELVMHSYFIAARRAISRRSAGGKRRFWPFG